MRTVAALEQSDAHIAEVAAYFSQKYALEEQAKLWSEFRYTHTSPPSQLHLDDVSGIPFLDNVTGVAQYQLRARVRARDGDIFAATVPDLQEYEKYNVNILNLGQPGFIQADGGEAPIRVAEACTEGRAFDEIVDAATERGGLTIHPYMGIESVYRLAQQLSAVSQVPVSVLAPPPPITWYANDKVMLHRLVMKLLGDDYVVDTRIANTAEELASDIVGLASHHETVAWKMARCASAMGNSRFTSAEVRHWSAAEAVANAKSFLAEKQWVEGDDVLTVAWETTGCSPSTQLWIPPLGAGEIRLDGCYEQLLVGPDGMFLGSIPSRLPAAVNLEMAAVSRQVARVYQQLGYVGRCSFDFILRDGQLRIVECNGRWGGTSTPMHLVDRLFPRQRPAYRARDVVEKSLVGASFGELQRRIGEAAYNAHTGRGSFILYNVGPLYAHGKFDVIALGKTVDEATQALEVELPSLLQR
ncbi:MAG: hypothetical protein VX223_17305 [Myxococcota bacterium]|nr:hypothetical protein [Myxococcota bacterium]